jgi:deoxycytidylate deaminase
VHATHGQNVQSTYSLADLFVDTSNIEQMQSDLKRFVRTFFGYQFHTPTRDEYGMYFAMATARRSADLSRQVGAAIADTAGNIIAVGCNEVPKPEGGMYWEGDSPDRRDFRLGYDSNSQMKDEIVAEMLHRIMPDQQPYDDTQLRFSLKGSRIMNLLEFGRGLHAEMAALICANQQRFSVAGTTMYVTTFPCHLSAKHILAAGIKRVVYMEPYAKSAVKQLYRESVAVDGLAGGDDCVRFEPFVGIAPRQYLTMFEIPTDPKREDQATGRILHWDRTKATPEVPAVQPLIHFPRTKGRKVHHSATH